MKTVYRRRSSFGLNLTPLIDIVFLLLVFFMLTAHFVQDETVAVELPEARASVPSDDQDALEVLLAADGRLLVEGETVAIDQLERVLRSKLHARTNRQVRLRGDRTAQLGVTVQVMDAARLAGAESFDIITEQP